MPVTRSTAATSIGLRPALVAAAGAPRLTERVRPAGIEGGVLAGIFAPVWFVVTAQVEVVKVAGVGWLPAVAVLIVREGAPLKAIWLIAFTWKVTVWGAVWARAGAARVRSVRAAATAPRRANARCIGV